MGGSGTPCFLSPHCLSPLHPAALPVLPPPPRAPLQPLPTPASAGKARGFACRAPVPSWPFYSPATGGPLSPPLSLCTCRPCLWRPFPGLPTWFYQSIQTLPPGSIPGLCWVRGLPLSRGHSAAGVLSQAQASVQSKRSRLPASVSWPVWCPLPSVGLCPAPCPVGLPSVLVQTPCSHPSVQLLWPLIPWAQGLEPFACKHPPAPGEDLPVPAPCRVQLRTGPQLMNAGLGPCVGSFSIPGARHGGPEGVLGLDLSSCSSGLLRGPPGAVAPSCWDSRDLPERGLEGRESCRPALRANPK